MHQSMKKPLITILGPTASGKTTLAVALAAKLEGEIVSADSRQVYQGLDLGSGKDLEEYQLDGKPIPYHLIDVVRPHENYDVYRFQADFFEVYQKLANEEKWVILCGGSGLYLQAALASKKMLMVPTNEQLRAELSSFSQAELVNHFTQLKADQHNTTDLEERERTLRAIEIALAQKENPIREPSPVGEYHLFGLKVERSKLRARIKQRLEVRFKQGMIEEVEGLMQAGLSVKKLHYFGLEYRYIASYLSGDLSYAEMFEGLLQAIRKFAKKQETWFRRMEKQGETIHWLAIEMQEKEMINRILQKVEQDGL
jgi:tRNA dimethylallyltransferase